MQVPVAVPLAQAAIPASADLLAPEVTEASAEIPVAAPEVPAVQAEPGSEPLVWLAVVLLRLGPPGQQTS